MAEYYVSTTGNSGNPGTIGSPWNLAHAFSGAGGTIQPGDTIWIRGGTYTQGPTWSVTVSGNVGTSVDNPDGKVKFRNFPAELASITTTNTAVEAITLDCSFVWFWGTIGQAEALEVWRNVTERTTTRGTNIWYRNSPQDGNKLIHVITRDGGNGVLSTNGAGTAADYGDMELYGLVSFNNGQDNSPRTHGVYIQHTSPTGKKFRMTGPIIFNTLGHGAQLYTEITGGMDGYETDMAIIFNAGVLGTATSAWDNFLFGVSAQAIKNSKHTNLVLFHTGASSEKKQVVLGTTGVLGQNCEFGPAYIVGGDSGQGDLVDIRDFRVDGNPSLNFHNVFISRRAASPVRLIRTGQTGSLANYSGWANNVYSGRTASQLAWRQNVTDQNFATWKAATGLGASDTQVDADPTTNKVFVFPLTKYNPGYGHVCFFNWSSGGTVNVDLSTILSAGDQYNVFNAQTPTAAPILSGTYAGGNVAFPTTGVTPPTPVGTCPRSAPTTAPFFDAFIVVRTGSTETAPTLQSPFRCDL